jgi:hypothetical protein
MQNSDWKSDFAMLLLSDKIEQPHSLKHLHIPGKIYKYRTVSEHALSNFRNDTVWISSPKT